MFWHQQVGIKRGNTILHFILGNAQCLAYDVDQRSIYPLE